MESFSLQDGPVIIADNCTQNMCIIIKNLFKPIKKSETLPGWAIALIVIAAILAVGGVATGIALYWKEIKQND